MVKQKLIILIGCAGFSSLSVLFAQSQGEGELTLARAIVTDTVTIVWSESDRIAELVRKEYGPDVTVEFGEAVPLGHVETGTKAYETHDTFYVNTSPCSDTAKVTPVRAPYHAEVIGTYRCGALTKTKYQVIKD